MKFVLAVLLFALGAAAQAKTAEINCINDRGGMYCDWQVLNGEPLINLHLVQDDDANIWRGVHVRERDGHRLTIDIRYEEELSQEGDLVDRNLRTKATLSTPQVSASTSGSNRVDIGLNNWNYGRGFFCRSIKIL